MDTAQEHSSRIAIVGSGIAGLTCAHLLGRRHEIVLIEGDDRLGGHAHTVEVADPDGAQVQVDTGFIVHNRRNYPNFVNLLDELGVATQPADMSFGVTDRHRRLSYRATNPSTVFADRRNLTRPAMWRMLVDVVRFWRAARRLLADVDGRDGGRMAMGEFLAAGRYSEPFLEWHLRPMISAIWSADPSSVDDGPASTVLRFLDNHGLLGLGDRPQWRTITGGSRRYVEAVERRIEGKVRTGCPVTQVRRVDGGVDVATVRGTERFDEVVLACHSDQALALLDEPTRSERDVLGAIRYQPNDAVLHTDTGVLPSQRRAWAAWNYDVDRTSAVARVTYDLTALQRLPGSRRYLVSLNLDDRIRSSSVVRRLRYAHPVLDRGAVAAQRRLAEINGVDRVHFCGAWAGYGFHEDGMASALAVCTKLGVDR